MTEFAFTDEQLSLRDLMHSWVDRELPEQAVRDQLDTPDGFDRVVWGSLGAELGVLGVAIPERLGGSAEETATGALCPGAVELALVAEELGRGLAGVPLLGSVALAATTLVESGEDAHEVVADLVLGRRVAALVATDDHGRWAPGTAVTADGDGHVSGTASHVLDALAADLLVVVARTAAGPTLHLVEGAGDGVTREPQTTLDQTRRLGRVTFDRAPARPVGAPGGAGDPVARARDVGALVLAAEAVGAGRRLLDMSVEHAGTRLQFGRAIGSFQGVKHRCADMYVELEQARSTAYHAAWAQADPHVDDPRTATDLATVVCAAAFQRLAKETVQVHGGIGFTWEHPTHLYYKRAMGDAVLLGGRPVAADRLATAVLDAVS